MIDSFTQFCPVDLLYSNINVWNQSFIDFAITVRLEASSRANWKVSKLQDLREIGDEKGRGEILQGAGWAALSKEALAIADGVANGIHLDDERGHREEQLRQLGASGRMVSTGDRDQPKLS
jgi:hypothetical protein